MKEDETKLPQHVAIIMDGNGRWANRRFMPRAAGHRAGAKVVRKAVTYCKQHGIAVLSLFALSVENYLNRPEPEIQFLMTLFADALLRNTEELHQSNVKIRFMGDLSILSPALHKQVAHAQSLTTDNTGLTLVLAIHYSGRWDIVQAAKRFARATRDQSVDPDMLTEADFSRYLCLHDLPEPDLLIRTSGEQRISNFMLWQFAYTELFFTDAFWPDFNEAEFSRAIAAYQKRERRFGLTSEQMQDVIASPS